MLFPSFVAACLLAPLVQDDVALSETSDATTTKDTVPELLAHEQLNGRLRALADAHPALAEVHLVGRSRGEREILALRLAAGEVENARPAILVIANMDGPQVFSSAVALTLAERLADEYGADDETSAFLDSTTLYVLPRVNPDAAEARFMAPLFEALAGGYGVDNDRDGRQGEDPPGDVNGDGFVTHMRVLDPEGTWMEDPSDPRALVKADPTKGELGKWKLWSEGRDSDGDELVAEDAPHDTHLNANFTQGWNQHHENAGLFPMDEPEARALAEFLLLHDDIALVLAYGFQDNLVKEPKSVKEDAPSVKRIPPPGVLEPDAKALAELGRRYAKIVEHGIEGRGDAKGSLQSWTYVQRGLPTRAVSLWDIPLDAKKPEPEAEEPSEADDSTEGAGAAGEGASKDEGAAESAKTEGKKPGKSKDEPKPSGEAKRLPWIDLEEQTDRFLPWTAFEHPELGEVEIGGFAPYARLEPPDADAARIATEQHDFVRSLGALLPRVRLSECTSRDLGGGLIEVEAAVVNDSLLPLRAAAAKRARSVRPARLTLIVPEGAQVIAGRRVQLLQQLDGGARMSFRWLVRGAPANGLGLEIETDNAGTDQCRPEVQR